MKKIFLTAAIALQLFVLQGQTVSLNDGKMELRIDCKTLETEASVGKTVFDLSEGLESGNVRIVEQSKTKLVLSLSDKQMTFTAALENGYALFAFTARSKCSLHWPVYRAPRNSRLIWMKGDGRYIPEKDRQWAAYLNGDHELMESPLWGHGTAAFTIAWAAETPFRSSLEMDNGKYELKQTFLVRRGTEEHRFRFALAEGENPLLPASLYRQYLEDSGQFLTYKEKIASLPVDSAHGLEGAALFYLYGGNRISMDDVKPGKWRDLAEGLLNQSDLSQRILSLMDTDSLEAVKTVARERWPGGYAKGQMIRGVGDAVNKLGEETIYRAFIPCLNKPDSWGQGVSPVLVRELKALGIDRARLTAEGMENKPLLMETAEEARRDGYLFGVYDSYHSIHPSSLAGTDASWETAQFPDDLFVRGGIMKADGSYYRGFHGIGRLLNPVAARPYFEERVNGNLKKAPFTFYFIDCDGSGEIYEDYNPLHPTTSEEAAAARLSRLRWLREEKGLIVGTEGGDPFTVSQIFVAEGPLSPVFFWEDPDFKKKDSPYFIGRYWPPGAPEIQFKEIPLKKLFMDRYFNPETRIPLFEAIFHDSVEATNHWGSDMLKYIPAQKIIQLQQMLYLSPPLYNLSRDRLRAKGEVILRNYRFFSPLHRKYGFSRLIDFKVLSPDRLFQKTVYEGGLEMLVNFSDEPRYYENLIIAPKTAAALEKGKKPVFYTP